MSSTMELADAMEPNKQNDESQEGITGTHLFFDVSR
jgi:hypothetical protein